MGDDDGPEGSFLLGEPGVDVEVELGPSQVGIQRRDGRDAGALSVEQDGGVGGVEVVSADEAEEFGFPACAVGQLREIVWLQHPQVVGDEQTLQTLELGRKVVQQLRHRLEQVEPIEAPTSWERLSERDVMVRYLISEQLSDGEVKKLLDDDGGKYPFDRLMSKHAKELYGMCG